MDALDYGDTALLLEFDDTAAVLAAAGALRELPGVLDVVVGARTALLRLAGPADRAPVRNALAGLQVPEPTAASPEHTEIVIDVVYDGADLDDVADLTRLSPAEVVDAHTGTPWRVVGV